MKYSGERAHPNDSTFETDNEMQDKTIQHYKFAKKFISTGFVLDAGTALGFGVNELFPTTAEKIFAVEINKEAVKIATTKNKHKNLEFHIGDLTKLEFGNDYFSTTLCMEVIEHINKPETALDELARTLKKNGTLIISTPNKNAMKNEFTNAPNNPFHLFEFDKWELENFLLKKFSNVEIYYQDKVLLKKSIIKTILNFFIALDIFRVRAIMLNLFGMKIGKKFALTKAGKGDFSVKKFNKSDFKKNETPAFFIAVCKNKIN